MRTIRQKAMFRIIKRALILGASFQKNTKRLENFLSGITLAGLDPELRTPLTIATYAAKHSYKRDLFHWEQTWFKDDLPKPPAKILIGGAGTCAEGKYLVAKGYDTVSFEPVREFVDQAKKDMPKEQAVLCGSYEDLLDPQKPSTQTFQVGVVSHAPFDAVLLGWGSFTHVDRATQRLALLAKLKELCPSGPVLLSFWMRGNDELVMQQGRAFNMGWRIGSFLNRESQTQPVDTHGDSIRLNSGYGHAFSYSEFHKLVLQAGYRTTRNPPEAPHGEYPHATILPT